MKFIKSTAEARARRAWLRRNNSRFIDFQLRPQPRIFVDVSAICRHDARTGIQRVVRAVWSELAARSGTSFSALPVFATNEHGYCYAPLDFLEVPHRPNKLLPVSMGLSDQFLGLDLAAHLLPKYRQQLESWREAGAQLSVFIYDLLPLTHPQWFTSAASRNFTRWFDLVSNEFDRIFCISDTVADEVRRRLVGGPKIHRTFLGADLAASRPSTGLSDHVIEVLRKVADYPSVLMVGTIEPRKGYEAALAAFEELWKQDGANAPALIIVGKGGWKTEALQKYIREHPENGSRLHWLDNASDQALCQLYEAAAVVLVASRAEGFGFPLIEAALHGRRVIARDLRVFREQRLPNVSYFEDDRPPSLANEIRIAIARGDRASSVSASLPTWKTCVDKLVEEMGVDRPRNQLDLGGFDLSNQPQAMGV